MMQPSVTAMLKAFGAAYTLWRAAEAAGANSWSSGVVTNTFYPCRARAKDKTVRTVHGTIAETEKLLIVDAASLAIVPVKGDRVAKGTYTANQAGAHWHSVLEVYAPEDGAAVPVYRLRVSL